MYVHFTTNEMYKGRGKYSYPRRLTAPTDGNGEASPVFIQAGRTRLVTALGSVRGETTAQPAPLPRLQCVHQLRQRQGRVVAQLISGERLQAGLGR